MTMGHLGRSHVVSAATSRTSCLAAGALSILIVAAAHAGDLATLRARGTLRVLSVTPEGGSAAADEGAPAAAKDSPGFELEILDGFARLHQLRIEMQPIKRFDQLVPALLAGGADVIAGGFTATEDRKRWIDFTTETFPNREVIVSRRPRARIGTVSQLRALTKIGAVQGSSGWQALRDAGIPESSLVPHTANAGASAALSAGRFQAVLLALEVAVADARADPDLQIGMFLGPLRSYAFGLRKETPELRAALSDYIANLRRSGGWNRLAVKYYGADVAEVLKKIRE